MADNANFGVIFESESKYVKKTMEDMQKYLQRVLGNGVKRILWKFQVNWIEIV